jgi:hypothetical protein
MPLHIAPGHAPARSRVATALAVALALGTTLALTGCGEEDATSIKINLTGKDASGNPDFSGEVIASSVVIAAEDPGSGTTPGDGPGPVERASSGVTWQTRAALVMSRGTFAKLDQLTLADLRFEPGTTSAGATFLKVIVPRGPQAKWAPLLTTTDEPRRKRAAAALAPDAAASPIGATASLVINLPPGFRVVSSGVTGRGRGLAAGMDVRTATLTVPVEVALGGGLSTGDAPVTEPLIWHITWEREKAN